MRVALLLFLAVCGCTWHDIIALSPRCITGLRRWKDVEVYDGTPPAEYTRVRDIEVASDHPDLPTGKGIVIDALKMLAHGCKRRGDGAVALGNVRITDTHGWATVYIVRE